MVGNFAMEITFSVVSYHRFTSDFESKKTLLFNDKQQTFVVGRSEQCDWFLPDPERVISSKHAYIERQSNKLVIVDMSTNGVFINRSVKPLGKNTVHILADGDCVAFGDYEIDVLINHVHVTVPNEKSSFGNEMFQDDCDFGIPTRELSRLSQSNESHFENSEMASSLTVFSTHAEDSFIAPSTEAPLPELLHDLPIPEDWSAMLTTEPVELQSGVLALNQPERHHEETFEDGLLANNSRSTNEMSCGPDDMPDGLDAFVRGLGISQGMIPPETDEQWWYELGVSMQCLMTGLMDSLHQRAAFKQTSRLNQTHFKRQENNPLKFSATLEDAIHNLFSRKSTSFLPPEQAIKEAFLDIGKHEKALLAGVDGAVGGIMKTLSPESIVEIGADQNVWFRFSPGSSKIKSWNAYEAMYRRLENDLKNSSEIYCWDDFVKSYEASLREVK